MILVFSNRPYGGPVIDNVPIPGRFDPVSPARIPFKVYYKNRSHLRLAPYTPDRMRAIFGGEPPGLWFTYNDIRLLSFSDLVDLCQYFKITSPKIQRTEDRRKAIREFLREHG